jgi:ankyrin repeat protein
MRLLLDHDAEVDAQDEDHFTPLQLAESYGNAEGALLLLEHGANVDARDEGQTPSPH